MLIENEKRAHTRCLIECPFIVYLDTTVHKGHTRNISRGGVLARISEGNLNHFKMGMECECFIKSGSKTVGLHCQVMRAAGHDIALQFINIDFDQDLFLRTLIESSN